MADENNRKSKREVNEKAIAQLKEKNIELQNVDNPKEKIYHATGAGALANLFNNLVSDIEIKAQKEADKPRYRFLELMSKLEKDKQEKRETPNLVSMIFKDEFIEAVSELKDQLNKNKYEVEIIENLDCKNVTVENRYYIRISHKNNIFVDIDLFKYEQYIKDFTFNEQDFIENQIAKIVGNCNYETKEIAGYIADYLAHIMYFKELYTITYKKIGWDVYNWSYTGWIFKYDHIYTTLPLINGKGKTLYSDGLEIKNETKDKEYKWIDATMKLLNNHEYCCAILGAGISGLVRQLLPYTKENNININICGKTASGKSTICHYLLSIFGNPEKLEGSFTDTDNKMEENRIKRPIMPYVLDERMLKIENVSEKTKKQTVLMDIFREYEGKVKERMGKQYEEYTGERTYGPIISSSVRSMMDYIFESDDLGQYRRFIEFSIGGKDEHLLFSNKKEAENIEKLSYNNYGYGIRIIVEYMLVLLNMDENIGEAAVINQRFNQLNNEIEEVLKSRETDGVTGLVSSAKRFALIILSYQMLRESLLYYIYGMFKELLTAEKSIAVIDPEEVKPKELNDLDRKNKEFTKDLIDKINNDEEISNIVDNFEDFAKSDLFIKNMSWNILDILVDNLVLKIKKVNIIQQPKSNNALYDYILSNPEYFIEKKAVRVKEGQELIESNGTIIGVYTKDNEKITLYTKYEYHLDQFLCMEPIPAPEEIKKFILEYEKEFSKKFNKTFEEYLHEKIKGGEKRDLIPIKELATEIGKRFNALGPVNSDKERTNKTIYGNTVYFSRKELIFHRPDVEDKEEKEEGES